MGEVRCNTPRDQEARRLGNHTEPERNTRSRRVNAAEQRLLGRRKQMQPRPLVPRLEPDTYVSRPRHLIGSFEEVSTAPE